MARIVAAVELGRSGARAAARVALETLWNEMGKNDADPFHQCVLAHFMADLQEGDQAELHWDELALHAVASVTDERAQEYDSSLQVRGLMPSLYLSLADDHRRLGEMERAQEFLDQARSVSDALGNDPYGLVVKSAFEKIAKALAEGSTERLPDDH
jgi:hypothetical protein